MPRIAAVSRSTPPCCPWRRVSSGGRKLRSAASTVTSADSGHRLAASGWRPSTWGEGREGLVESYCQRHGRGDRHPGRGFKPAGPRTTRRQRQRSADGAVAHVARTAGEGRGDFGIEVRAATVERGGVRL